MSHKRDFRPASQSATNITRITLSTYVALAGFVSFLGWVLDVPRLTDWNGNGISIQPNTTVGAMVAGVALLVLSFGYRRACGFLGVITALIGANAVLQNISGLDFGTDSLLMFGREWGRLDTLAPGRMGPPSAISFSVLGIALLLCGLNWKARRFVPPMSLFIIAVGMLSAAGYFFGASTLYSLPQLTAIAFQTSTMLLAAGIALLTNVPERFPMKLLLGEDAAGMLVRRTLPLIIAIPFFAGWLRIRGQEAGFYDSAFGVALMVLTIVALLAAFIGWSALKVKNHDERQRDLERILREREARLAGILGSITDGFVTFDKEWRYSFINEEGIQLLGRSGEELIGKVVWEVFPESVDGAAYRELHRAASLRTSLQFEDFNPSLNRWFAYKAYPTADDGIAVYFEDITSRKQVANDLAIRAGELADALADRNRLLESERAARTEAERALRSKDDFLSTISHELRTPLNAILGWAQLLTRSHDAAIQKQGLEAIERGARAQAKLIEDLLDASRMSSGKMRLELAILDLGSLVNASLDSLRLTANAKSIRLSLILDSEAGPVLGDPGRLQQVVTNLLSNALKFTPVGGRVEMQVCRVGSWVELSVEDNGAGIAPEFLPYVFERFRQGDSSASREHGGLGLGLAIVRHLVLLHAGTVSASSDGVGKGSVFTVRLPIATARSAVAVKPSSDSAPFEKLSGIRVLVVDDDADSCEVVRRILVDCKAEVAIATSADEGLATIDKFRPNLLISDIGMPGKDGYALIRELRSNPAISSYSIPAVALTAFARSQDRIQSLKAGFSMHISKPVDPHELVHVVGALARESASSRKSAR